MLVFRGFCGSRDFFRRSPAPTALGIGNFDGVHLGHQALLGRIKVAANARSLSPAVLTFEPHPREFLAPHTAPTRLSTLREKLERIASQGIECAYVCRFGAALAACPAENFVKDILVDRLRVAHLVVGDDFRFGAQRTGDIALLQRLGQQHGFTVETLSGVACAGERVSSSLVRQALEAGDMEAAAQLLGQPYAISGRIVPGRQLGRRLGVPTANIRVKHHKPPLSGVFAVEVDGLPAGRRTGVANLGLRPSLGGEMAPTLEVHLFDFSGDLYGAHICVRFLHKLRDEQVFASLDALQQQIAQDIVSAKHYFSH